MYHPTTRLLTILELLQSHRTMGGKELSERLEVDGRTIRRYITMLQDMGIPIEAERGRYGGYCLRPGYKLPPMMFTNEEVMALSLSLLLARQQGLGVAAPAIEGTLAKIERVMPDALSRRVRAIQETLVVDLTLPDDVAPAHGTVATLSLAVHQEQRVFLTYQAFAGNVTERDVDPYGLAYRQGWWYVVGYCHLRSGLRTFRLDRVHSVEALEKSFVRPTDFDTMTHIEESIARTPGTWYIDMLLKTTLDDAQKQIPVEMAIPRETADGISLQCYVGDLDGMAHFVAGLSCPVIINEPVELREAVERLIEKLSIIVSN